MMQEKEKEKKVKQSMEELIKQLGQITESIPGGIGAYIVLGEQIKPLSVNQVLTGLMGYSKMEYMELFGEDVSPTIYEEDLPRVREVIEQCTAKKQRIENAFRLNKKDGDISWVSLSMQKTGDYNGASIFYIVMTDINHQIENEQKIQEAYELMHYRTVHDSLTGICNRENFYTKVRKILAENLREAYVLVRWNVERFKVINDLFGIETGDRILKDIAEMMRETFGKKGVYARLEADHFVLFYPEGYITPEELLRKSDEKFREYQKNYSVMCSLGIYRVEERTVPIDQMCDRANMALQTIKGSYIRRYAYYDNTLRKTMLEEQEIIGEMDRALQEEQFQVFVQPIFGVISNMPEGGEALIRWRHPKKGLLSPGLFIPLFERNGFITKLDHYVWEKTCKNIHKCMIQGEAVVPISVNVSRINLYNPNLPEEIAALTKKYKIPNHMLKLEITESAYMDNPQQLMEITKRLQKKGFRILMDDFGSGYSSLNMIKDLPVDVLKIDMRFIDDLEKSKRVGSVVTSIIRMARRLDIGIIAEGVETKSQLDFLRTIGCECVQGFFFARPMPMEEFNALLHENKQAGLQDDMGKILERFDFDAIWINKEITILFNGLIQGMAFYEMDKGRLRLLRANDGFYEMLGEDPIKVHPESSFLRIVATDEQTLLKTCARAQQSGKIEDVLVRRRHKDGHMMWLEIKIRFLGYRGNRTLFYLAMNETVYTMKGSLNINENETETQLKELLKDEKYIIECARNLGRIHDVDMAINQVLERLLSYYQAERSYVFEFDWENGKAVNTYERCALGVNPEIANLQNVEIKAVSFWIEQFSSQRYIHISDVDAIKDTRRSEWEYLAPQQIHSLMAVPFYSDKTLRGFIGVDNPAIEWDKPHFLINLTYFISNEIEKKNMHKELRYLSYHDALTGLYNRNRYLIYEESFVNTFKRKGAGIVFLDVNGLKQINDNLGHKSGDKLIVGTARMMQAAFPEDMLFRLSGDEFLVVCDDCEEADFMKKVGKIRALNVAEGKERASIGAVWKKNPENIEELTNMADCQMYLQKKAYYAKNSHNDRRKRQE